MHDAGDLCWFIGPREGLTPSAGEGMLPTRPQEQVTTFMVPSMSRGPDFAWSVPDPHVVPCWPVTHLVAVKLPLPMN